MKRFNVQTRAIALFCMLLLLGCASQQDVVTLDDRLAAIERHAGENEQKSKKIEARLDEYLKKEGQDFRERTADQNVLINTLRDDVRNLRGRVEEIEHLVKTKDSNDKRNEQLKRIEQLLNLNQERIVHIEEYLNLEIGAPEQKPAKDKTSTSDLGAAKALTVSELYQSAKQAFDRGDLESARAGFQQLLERFPKSEQADNAQFWIGETYFREKWYEKAILEYQKVIEKYPKGNKVPASLLKQGIAFSDLGDRTNARLILTELVNKYPKSNEAQIAKQQLKGLKP